MLRRLARELENLDAAVIDLSARAEDAARTALRAFLENNGQLAAEVIAADSEIDLREMEIEEECLKLIALHQPVAADLRHIIGVVKINQSLERAADLAVNLCRKTRTLAKNPSIASPHEITDMGERAVHMLHDAINAFVRSDAALARDVILRDNEVDRLKKSLRKACEQAIMADPSETRVRLAQIAAGRNLERLGDMAAEIAENVIQSLEGEMIRHPKLRAEKDTEAISETPEE